MTQRELTEQQIREVLDSESAAVPLSDKLFGPDGLFGRLARTEEERRTLTQSPLFKQAQRRLTELQRAEAEAFARIVEQAQGAVPEGKYLIKLERVEAP